jgi:hypothetical protein
MNGPEPLNLLERLTLIIALAVCTFIAVVGSILIAQQPGGSLGKTVAVPGGCFLKIFCWNEEEPHLDRFQPEGQKQQPKPKGCPGFLDPNWDPNCAKPAYKPPKAAKPDPKSTEWAWPDPVAQPPIRPGNAKGCKRELFGVCWDDVSKP